MSFPWHKRKTRLSSLIGTDGGEDAEALVLDQFMHGQTVIGGTGTLQSMNQLILSLIHLPTSAKTIQIDSLRFTDNDLDLVGTLEYGQFGVVSN